MHSTKILIAAFLVLGGLLTLTPTATAQATATETFDTYTSGALPCRPNPTFAQPCTGDYYDYSHVTGAFQVTGATFDGASGKSFHATGTSNFDSSSALCSQPISLALRLPTSYSNGIAVTLLNPTAPAAGNSQYIIQLTLTTTTEGAAATAKLTIARYQNSASSSGSSDTGVLTFTNSFSASTFYHFSIYCQTGADAGTIVLVSPEAQAIGNAPVSVSYAANSGTSFIEMTRFRLQGASSASGVYLDTLETATPTTTESQWCSDPSVLNYGGDPAADFGYDYVEDWIFESNLETGFGIQSGFSFQEDEGELGFMGKGFTTGTKALSTQFKVEAGSDGFVSKFWVAYTNGAGGLPSVSTKGDGTDGGNFDDHIQLQFEEFNNQWRIGFYYNLAGAGLTQQGASYFNGIPTTPANYVFEANTGNEAYDSPFSTTDLNPTVARLINLDTNAAYTFLIPTGLDTDTWKDQWFVVESDGIGASTILQAKTVIDNNDATDEDFSTCITGLDIVFANSQGSLPTVTGNTTTTSTTAPGFDDLSESFGSVFGGIGATGGAVFLGIFWILIFAAGAYGILGGSPLAIGIGALCGFVFSIFTGLIPDILVFVVVLLAGAAVGMRLFGGGGSGADG